MYKIALLNFTRQSGIHDNWGINDSKDKDLYERVFDYARPDWWLEPKEIEDCECLGLFDSRKEAIDFIIKNIDKVNYDFPSFHRLHKVLALPDIFVIKEDWYDDYVKVGGYEDQELDEMIQLKTKELCKRINRKR